MTMMCLAAMTGSGLPVWVFAVAIACDTALLMVAMLTGIIHH